MRECLTEVKLFLICRQCDEARKIGIANVISKGGNAGPELLEAVRSLLDA